MLDRIFLRLAFACAIGFLSISCGSRSEGAGEIPQDEFEAAVAEAQSSLPVVRRALLAPEPSYVFIGLKIRVYGEAEFEDIWTEPVDYFDGAFTTQMVEGVALTQGFHPEQQVRIPVKDVIDWMIVEENGHLIGGYTIRLAYKYMTPEEQKEFLRITGYVID